VTEHSASQLFLADIRRKEFGG